MDSYIERAVERVLWGAIMVDCTLRVVGRDGAQMAECLSRMQGTLGSITVLPELDSVVLVYNLST